MDSTLLQRKLVLLSLALGLGAVQSSYATQSTEAFETLTVTLKAPEEVKDLTINISNSRSFTCPELTGELFVARTCTKTGDTTARIDLSNPSDFGIAKGSEVTVGIKIKSAENDFKVVDAKWTRPNGTDRDIPEKNYDLKVTPVGDPQSIFTIRNDNPPESNVFLTFANLRFLNNSGELPLGAPVGSLSGFLSFDVFFGFDTLILPPMSLSDDFLFPEIAPGAFLYIESTVFVSTADGVALPDSSPTDVRFGHQAPLEEPATYHLIAFSLLLLWTLRLARHRLRRS